MIVTAVVPLYPPTSLVGAWVSTHRLLVALVAAGHDVTAVVTHRHDVDDYVLDGVRVVHMTRGTVLDRAIRTADVVISHAGDNLSAPRFAARHQVPSIRLVHGHLTSIDQCDGAALVVWNSHTNMAAGGHLVSAPQIVVHPPIDPAEYSTTPGDRIGLVNLCEAKGGRLFWRLARAMPDHLFLGVRGGYGNQVVESGHRNVEIIAPTPNVRDDVYGRCRIMLMPSSSETFGRVGVEAACSGIPTIAHPTPGLVEALGSAGVFVDRADAAGWVEAIRAFDGPACWQAASVRARARAGELTTEGVARFVDAVESIRQGVPA
jgi:glycosyltransferase involved in cell wall biosynthesis